MTRAFKIMAKSVAVSVGIVLMGAVFSGCGVSGVSVNGVEVETCKGEGVITLRSDKEIENRKAYKEVGECKNGLKEGVWKTYNTQNKVLQEADYLGGVRNGITKIYYTNYSTPKEQKRIFYANGKIIGEMLGEMLGYIFYQYDEYGEQMKRFRKYDIRELLKQDKAEHYKKVRDIESQNRQTEEAKWDAEQKLTEAKQKAVEIAKQRAQSKVKKPTVQEVKKSKAIMDKYRANLQAQTEKELQIELAKIQVPQIMQKQLQEIPEYKQPKLDTYEEFLAFVKDKKHTFEEHINRYDIATIESIKDLDGNFKVLFKERAYGVRSNSYQTGCEIENDGFRGADGCWNIKKNHRFKDMIEKSIFKDKINAILPKK